MAIHGFGPFWVQVGWKSGEKVRKKKIKFDLTRPLAQIKTYNFEKRLGVEFRMGILPFGIEIAYRSI